MSLMHQLRSCSVLQREALKEKAIAYILGQELMKCIAWSKYIPDFYKPYCFKVPWIIVDNHDTL